MGAVCGAPGLMYPESRADAAALAAGPGAPCFWASSMVLRCPAHAPPGRPVTLIRADGPMNCEWAGGAEPPPARPT